VGGAVFGAVLPLFNPGARMTICGLISHYTDGSGAGARAELMRRGEGIFSDRNVKVTDLFVGDYVDSHQDEFLREMSGWVDSGAVRYREDIRKGIDTVPTVFAELLRGGNFGKTLVQVSDDPTL
jgi:NADPH-dependent curcumin reductase